MELCDHLLGSICLHHRQGHMIDPSSTTVCSDPLPRFPQNVTSVDAVVQGVETPTRRLLGRSP